MNQDHQSDFLLKPYVVAVQGFGEFDYPAASRSKAMAAAWRSYQSCYNSASFKEFLRIAKVKLGDCSMRFGEPITVGSLPAFYVGERGQYVCYVRPKSAVIHLSHPADVISAAGTNHAR